MVFLFVWNFPYGALILNNTKKIIIARIDQGNNINSYIFNIVVIYYNVISKIYTFMTNFKLDISYDGTDFFGWQIQKDKRTVQGDILNAFNKDINSINNVYFF